MHQKYLLSLKFCKMGYFSPCQCWRWDTLQFLSHNLNPFVPNALFLTPRIKSENFTVFLCFQGVEKECIWTKSINIVSMTLNYSLGFYLCQITFNLPAIHLLWYHQMKVHQLACHKRSTFRCLQISWQSFSNRLNKIHNLKSIHKWEGHFLKERVTFAKYGWLIARITSALTTFKSI